MSKVNHHSRPVHGRRLLRVLRAERQLTQHEVAASANLTQTRYWQIEHGEGAPLRAEEAAAIAGVLAVAPQAVAWPARELTPLQQRRAAAQERRRQATAAMTGGRG